MNIVSKENIKIAEFARIETMTGVMCYAVTLWKNGCCSYVSDKYGIMLFDNHLEAFKAVFKVRSDLPFRQYPTSTPRLPVLSPPLPPEQAGILKQPSAILHQKSTVAPTTKEEAGTVRGLQKILYVPVTRKVSLTDETFSLPANHVYF